MEGKAKIDFEKWFITTPELTQFIYITDFWKAPVQFQFGVIQDFFDSVGIQIDIEFKRHEDGEEFFTYYFDEGEDLDEYKTRTEARQAAINKAVEIYNQ